MRNALAVVLLFTAICAAPPLRATSSGIQTIGWQDHFATTAGGGIDVRVSKRFSIRPVQAEYFMTKIPDGLNNRQNNSRFSTGVSLLIGRK